MPAPLYGKRQKVTREQTAGLQGLRWKDLPKVMEWEARTQARRLKRNLSAEGFCLSRHALGWVETERGWGRVKGCVQRVPGLLEETPSPKVREACERRSAVAPAEAPQEISLLQGRKVQADHRPPQGLRVVLTGLVTVTETLSPSGANSAQKWRMIAWEARSGNSRLLPAGPVPSRTPS